MNQTNHNITNFGFKQKNKTKLKYNEPSLATCWSVALGIKGRGILILKMWLDKNMCSSGWVINILILFSPEEKDCTLYILDKSDFWQRLEVTNF